MELLASFIDYLQLEKNYSLHTITAYENDIASFFTYAKSVYDIESPDEVEYTIIRSWIILLVEQDVSNRSVNRKIASLKAYYKFLLKTEVVKNSPLQQHKALKVSKKVQIPFSEKEVSEVLEFFHDQVDFISVRNRLIVELFYATGMRRSELINLKNKDVDIPNAMLKVLGKRNKERYIPMILPLKKTISQYLELRDENLKILEGDYLILTDKGTKIYETLVYRIVKGYFSKVSHKVKISPHMLRHTFATHLLNHGADLNAVKELLGHASLAATQVYTHNSIAELSKIHQKTHPRNKEH